MTRHQVVVAHNHIHSVVLIWQNNLVLYALWDWCLSQTPTDVQQTATIYWIKLVDRTRLLNLRFPLLSTLRVVASAYFFLHFEP